MTEPPVARVWSDAWVEMGSVKPGSVTFTPLWSGTTQTVVPPAQWSSVTEYTDHRIVAMELAAVHRPRANEAP